jgi:hypothetical protein
MIQDAVKRMASNSFFLKGWAVTIIAGVFALASKDANPMYFLIAYIPICVFWFLDSYYLQLERRYRALYKNVCNSELKVDFLLAPPKESRGDKTLFYQSLLSQTELGLYCPLAIVVVIVIVLTAMSY